MTQFLVETCGRSGRALNTGEVACHSEFFTMNSISWPDPSDPGRISLAYRDLSELPEGWHKKLSFGDITALDLSHNNLSYPCAVSACSDIED